MTFDYELYGSQMYDWSVIGVDKDMETEIRVISILENDIKSEEGLFDTFGGITIYVEQHY